MAKYYTSIVSATSAVDWHDLFGTGGVLNGKDFSEIVLRFGSDTRVNAGAALANPGVSTTAGTAVKAGQPITISYSNAGTKNLWIQSPASKAAVSIEIDLVQEGKLLRITT